MIFPTKVEFLGPGMRTLEIYKNLEINACEIPKRKQEWPANTAKNLV